MFPFQWTMTDLTFLGKFSGISNLSKFKTVYAAGQTFPRLNDEVHMTT
jgi:hypothetical protein